MPNALTMELAADPRPSSALVVRPSQAYNAGAFTRYAVLAVAACWLYAAFQAFWNIPFGVLAMILTMLGARAAWKWLDLRCLSYRFEHDRIVWSRGVFGRQSGSLEVYRVQTVLMEQPLSQRLFGTGNLMLQTQDTTNPYLLLLAMREPETMRDRVTELVQRARRARGMQEVVAYS